MLARNKTATGTFLGYFTFVNLESKSIEKINHYFFESGHNQNKNDSVHSVIERSAK